MNTDTTDTTNGGAIGAGTRSLKDGFGDRGTNVNAIAYGHPYAEQIIEGAKEVLRESETGQVFVKLLDYHKIPVTIMKGTGEGGFSPQMKTIILQIPGKTNKATGEVIFNLTRAIRDADQEYAGLTAPDPMKDVLGYAGFVHARNLDSLTYVCKVVKELTNSSSFPVLLDTLTNLGLNRFYKAFLDGASKEELYDHYAEAYDNRGSI